MSGLSPFSNLAGLKGGIACPSRTLPQTFEAVAYVDLTEAEALLIVPGYDLGPGSNSGLRLACRDSNGRAALGFAGPAGTGAEPGLGAEAIANGSFDADVSGWTAGGSGIISSVPGGESGNCLKVLEGGALNPFAEKQSIPNVTSALYLASVSTKQGDAASYRWGIYHQGAWAVQVNGIAGDAWVQDQKYYTVNRSAVTLELKHLASSGAGTYVLFDEVSIKRITNPGAEGLTIYQGRDLSARGWAWVDPSFNPNDITEVVMDQTPDLRLVQVGVDLGGPALDVGAGDVSFSPGTITKETITPTGLPAMEMFKHQSASAGFPAYQLAGNFDQAAGQSMVLVVPGLSSAELLALADPNYNTILSMDGTQSSLLYQYVNSGLGYDSIARSYDGTGSAHKAGSWAADEPLFLVAQWWDAARQPAGTANAIGKRVGVATISGGVWSIAWGDDATYDGAYSVGSLIRLFVSNPCSLHWDNFLIHARPQAPADLLALINRLAPPA